MTTTSSISGTDNNNAVLFFENVSSSFAGPMDHREASIMLPINNNNAGAEIIYISDEEPDLESSLSDVNINSAPSILSTTEQTNQPTSNLLTLQRNLRINTANNNHQQDGVSLDLSLHQFGGDGGGSFSTIDVTDGGTGGGGGGGDGLLMRVFNNTSTRRIMPMKRTAPDYAHREFTVGESSSDGGAGGGSVAQPMAAPKRRPIANENEAVRISSSSSNTCTCTPSPTCPLHASTNNNISSSSREQRHETANNNNNPQNVVRVPSSLSPISEMQRALQSGSFQVLQPTTTTPPPPPNNNNNNATLGILELDDDSFIYPQPVFDSSHHHQVHHGHQRYFSSADTSPFRPASINYMENLPHHQYAGSSSSSPSPHPWSTVIRPRAIPSLSLPHRVGGSNRESDTGNNYPSGRGIITVTHNRGNSSSSTQLVESLVQNAGTPSAFQHLSDAALAWIGRLNSHDATLTRMSSSSTTDNTHHRPLRASAIAEEAYNLPTYFADDSRRLRRESRNAIQHLPSGDSVRELEELLILDYSNLLASIEEEEDANLPQYEPLADGQRVTNPDLRLTETEVAACIGQEIFQTVGQQPQNIDACGICQKDYVHGEELGRLDCAHRYHLSCIRQWLLIKNRCPVCKKMALTIIDLEDDEEHTMSL
ncbi:probable E3 ubiquitin-protein ligase HIP1 [Arachis ipaensis]|uniref:probable E3 ubiquitin-protein ligase HIP1 n=1 Tax=Arachis ipaensis TaxID=130454 RepID=UPI0007AF4B9B|nr:probable E3 ubiquitin-protein ligase HIP1 [Arachis ipaensis]